MFWLIYYVVCMLDDEILLGVDGEGMYRWVIFYLEIMDEDGKFKVKVLCML